jgi:hypothetical protein
METRIRRACPKAEAKMREGGAVRKRAAGRA